jgi:Cu-processing system permease protein
MNIILAIAKNTFREAIRDKILYAIFGFAALFILSTLFVAQLARGDIMPVKSFGLSGIYIFGLIASIFLGSSIIYKEIERRTLYFILSKPVSRTQIIIGKFFGLLGAVALTTILMLVAYEFVIFYQSGSFDSGAILAVCFQILEEMLFIALLIFLSSIIAPLTSTICAIIILFVGHLTTSALVEAKLIGGISYKAITAVYYIFPNLDKFDIRTLVVHNSPLPGSLGVIAVAYALVYSGLLLYCATIFFKKREL